MVYVFQFARRNAVLSVWSLKMSNSAMNNFVDRTPYLDVASRQFSLNDNYLEVMDPLNDVFLFNECLPFDEDYSPTSMFDFSLETPLSRDLDCIPWLPVSEELEKSPISDWFSESPKPDLNDRISNVLEIQQDNLSKLPALESPNEGTSLALQNDDFMTHSRRLPIDQRSRPTDSSTSLESSKTLPGSPLSCRNNSQSRRSGSKFTRKTKTATGLPITLTHVDSDFDGAFLEVDKKSDGYIQFVRELLNVEANLDRSLTQSAEPIKASKSSPISDSLLRDTFSTIAKTEESCDGKCVTTRNVLPAGTKTEEIDEKNAFVVQASKPNRRRSILKSPSKSLSSIRRKSSSYITILPRQVSPLARRKVSFVDPLRSDNTSLDRPTDSSTSVKSSETLSASPFSCRNNPRSRRSGSKLTRLNTNAIMAKMNREKKKKYVQDLEKLAEELRRENGSLIDDIKGTKQECLRMEAKLTTLKLRITQSRLSPFLKPSQECEVSDISPASGFCLHVDSGKTTVKFCRHCSFTSGGM